MKQYKWLTKRLISVVLVSVILAVTASVELGASPMAADSNPPPETEWENSFGGSDFEFAECVRQTADGGYIIAATTLSYGAGLYDLYIVKTDASGNLTWEKTFGGSGYDYARSVEQTTDGGYIIAGGTTSYGVGGDVYLVKTDASGNLTWENTFGGSDSDHAYSVQQTTDGGYIIAGEKYGAGKADFYLVKTDASGNLTWENTFGGSDWDHAYSARQTTDGGYIIAGSTTSYGEGGDVYLVKTDASGNKMWENTFGYGDCEYAESVWQTTDGGYIIAGTTWTYDVNGDVYLVKADASGNKTWEQVIGSGTWDDGFYVQQTTDGGYIIAGDTGSADEDGDAYLIKTDASGNVEWEKIIGGSDYDCSCSAQQTTDGGYILVGDTASYGAPEGDVYLVKVYPEINTPVGSNVTVSLENGTVNFQDVSANGTTTMTTSTYNPGGETPSDFHVIEEYFYEITTTANYSGPVTVGISYDESQVSNEESLVLFHWNGEEWEDVTTYVDTVGNIVYGQVASLSWFFIGEPSAPPIPPIADAGGPYLTQVNHSVSLNGSASYDPDGTIVSYFWDFGDNTTGSGVLVTHNYTAVGIYGVNLTVTDDSNAQSSDTTMAVVYDPTTGSATGGGWFWSAPGNLKGDSESEGKATFGFVTKYKQGVADGNLEFQYHVGDINLKSMDITWLVVSSPNANFQGEGTINGEGLYTFRVLAKDGDKTGGQPDELTIKIWEGTDTEADPIYQALNAELGGGNIIIHNN